MSHSPMPALPPPGSKRLGPRVPAIGPQPAEVLLVGLCPGRDEVILEEPFVGRSGTELSRFCDGETLPLRQDLRICNIDQQRPRQGEAPDGEEIAYWLPTLQAELITTKPKVIVPLGLIASRVFLGSDFTLERGHGLAHRSPFWLPAWTVPAYHPAAALHAPDLQSFFAADMDAVGVGLQFGFVERPQDTIAHPDYRLLPLDAEIPDAFSIDTEGWPDEPWCLTISWEAGAGYLVPHNDFERLAIVRKAVRRSSRTTCHQLLADLDVLAALDIEIPARAMDDTLVMAYNLAMEPQALKALGYRHLGAMQESYADVTHAAEEALTRSFIACIGATHEDKRVVTACTRVLAKIDDPNNLKTAKELWRNSKFSKVVDPVPRVTLDLIEPQSRAVTYACRDADLTERLRPLLFKRLVDRELEQVYHLDMGVIPIVNRMQHVGMQVDMPHFEQLVTVFGQGYARARTEIEACVGHDVNPNSGDQVAALLFDELGLPTTKMTKGRRRYSTEDKYLEAMRELHPVIPLLIAARELTKLLGTYAAAVLEQAEERDGVWLIFPHLRITRVVSGRVSAFNPNVLAIPKHSTRGKRIRHGFVAGAGRRLVSNDLSQIELRVLAHESQDKSMLRVYRRGGDLHADLGERVFGIKAADQDESKHRLPCKTVNFSMVMGASPSGLHDSLGKVGVHWSIDTCRDFIRETWKARPGVAAYIDSKHAQARRYGYVTDFCGRRRYVAGVSSADKWIRLQAEREAQATPIQAGAQEVFKAWMGNVWHDVLVPWLKRGDLAEPWLQVHDDLICVAGKKKAQRLGKAVRAVLPQMLRVPVLAEGKIGRRWSTLK